VPAETMHLILLAMNSTEKVLLQRDLSFQNADVSLSIFIDAGFMISL